MLGDHKFAIFSLIFVISNALLECSAMRQINDHAERDARYEEKFINQENKPDNLCNLSKEIKMAICSAVLTANKFAYFMEGAVYFNKAAAYYENPECVANPLKLPSLQKFEDGEYRDLYPGSKQDMFPCYGRHKIIRTNWNVDEYYDVLFLSGGPEDDSVYVYSHAKLIDSDTYVIETLYTEFGILQLEPLIITEKEAEKELEILNYLSLNTSAVYVEIYYTREYLNVPEGKRKLTPICELEKEKKLSLCKSIFEVPTLPYWNYIVNPYDFGTKSTECEEKKIRDFMGHLYGEERANVKHKVYPCYGSFKSRSDIIPVYYVGGGYRENSVLLFWYDNENSQNVFFDAIIENIRIEYIEPSNIPDRGEEVEEGIAQSETSPAVVEADVETRKTSAGVTDLEKLKKSTVEEYKLPDVSEILAAMKISEVDVDVAPTKGDLSEISSVAEESDAKISAPEKGVDVSAIHSASTKKDVELSETSSGVPTKDVDVGPSSTSAIAEGGDAKISETSTDAVKKDVF